jgi:hypothetical protein
MEPNFLFSSGLNLELKSLDHFLTYIESRLVLVSFVAD